MPRQSPAKNRNLRNLDIPISGLYLLAAPSTPQAAVKAIVERASASAARRRS